MFLTKKKKKKRKKKKHHSPCKVIDRIVVKVCRNLLIKLLYFLVCIQLLTNFQNTPGKEMKLTVARGVCRILTTEILERHVCPIGFFPHAGNYQISPPRKEMVSTLFTDSFHSLKND